MITNYTYFLLENKGINNVVIKYADKIYNIYKNIGFKKSIIDFNDNELPIKKCNIIFTTTGDSKFFTDKNIIIKDNFIYGYNFIFCINSEIESEIKSIFVHELTHAIEFYNIYKNNKSIPYYNIIKKTLLNTSNLGHPFEVFKHYIYLTLDNELNARVAQIYPYLISLQTNNYELLFNELKSSNIYKTYLEIKEFDVIKLFHYLQTKIGIDNLVNLINNLNNEIKSNKINLPKTYNFLDIIINEQNVVEYFTNWKVIFNNKIEKHIEKLINIIDKVIMDYNDKRNYSTN